MSDDHIPSFMCKHKIRTVHVSLTAAVQCIGGKMMMMKMTTSSQGQNLETVQQAKLLPLGLGLGNKAVRPFPC